MLATRTISKVLETHKARLEVTKDEATDIKNLMGLVTARHRTLPMARYSPYVSNLKSPLFGDLEVPSPAAPQMMKPHPPDTPRPKHVTAINLIRGRAAASKTRPHTTPEASTTIPLRPHFISSDVLITLLYIGRSLKLGGRSGATSCDVLVLQQHCGGNTCILYKGRVKAQSKWELLGVNWC